MSIPAGTRFGPYEIGAALGAGGMGEVYRARDTRLDRDVAIKVLPASLAQNAQFKLRFEREAKTISQLNHPHICTLHDIGANDGVGYLVMELVDGESLADILARGPLVAREILKYGIQVAEALAAAHRAGVVHRDLKPANVMITKSGAKLLDFGLAKSNVVQFDPEDATQHKPLTQEGTILGTFQYMAPEQLEGEEADARTDIFALGTLLYEMATGRRAFNGKTKTSLIAAIVKEQPPPMAELQPLTPPALQHVVDRCLAKEPDERWQSALDVASELRWISDAGSQAGVAAPLVSARIRRSRLMIAVAAAGWLVAIAAIVAGTIAFSRAQASREVTQLQIADPVGGSVEQPLNVSPDGRRVAMVVPGAATHLAVRDLESGSIRTLSGTEGANYPFWAPDGHAIAFFVPGALKVVDLETGAVQKICDAPAGRGGAWSGEGVIVFAPDYRSPLFKVGENGGRASAVTKMDPDMVSDRNPTFLPDGKHFFYCSLSDQSDAAKSSVRIGSVDGREDRRLLPYASNVAYVDGWLLSARERNLIAQRFDTASMSLQGKPVALAQNVEWYEGTVYATFSAGGDTLVYRRAADPKRQLLALDAAGAARPFGDAADYSFPNLSPDGRRIIVNRGDPAARGSDLWMLDLAGGNPVRLTFQAWGTMDDSSLFSPDGQRVVLVSNDAQGILRAWIQPVGGGAKEMLRPDSDTDWVNAGDWSPDGGTLLMNPLRTGSGRDLEMIHLNGRHEWVPLLHGTANETDPRISPNGRWMAYSSDESGRFEIYVTDFPGVSGKWQVSTGGGTFSAWSADGGKLYYLAGSRVVAATVHEVGTFSADPPKPIEALGDHITGFAASRNGQIVAVRELDSGVPPVTVVLNWRKLIGK